MKDDFVCVPIEAGLYAKLAQRMPNGGVRSLLEHIARDYVERTADDWLMPAPEEPGVTWGPIYLPTGTRLMMEYQGKRHFAEVKAEGIAYEGEILDSPAQLARVIANNTNRNAWRDLWVKRPKDSEWLRAQLLRQRIEQISSMELKRLFDD